MTDAIGEPFCPLYREAVQAAPWNGAASAHAGLLFDKFADAWRRTQNRNNHHESVRYEFDKGVGSAKQGANNWIHRFQRGVGDPDRLIEACMRQRQLVERLGGRSLLVTNTDRFVTGMGREHPLNNGFTWHHTLGVPYLPGSGLKGMLRAWLRETEGTISTHHGQQTLDDSPEAKKWFGTQGQAGELILLDMLPLEPPQLVVDVMTPHYGPYYQEREIPGDWHSPNPISFLVVEAGGSWQLGILPAAGARKLDDAVFQKLASGLLEAFEINGVGAKTAVGYGRFARDVEAEERRHREAEQRRLEEEQAELQAAEQKAFEASLAGASEPLRQLKKLRRDQNWQLSAGDPHLMKTLEEFSTNHPQPPQDCLDWIRDLLEGIPGYQGVWDSPDATRGKAKNPKAKYSSLRIRNLVKQLNPKFRR